jgi:hypothetical protein
MLTGAPTDSAISLIFAIVLTDTTSTRGAKKLVTPSFSPAPVKRQLSPKPRARIAVAQEGQSKDGREVGLLPQGRHEHFVTVVPCLPATRYFALNQQDLLIRPQAHDLVG